MERNMTLASAIATHLATNGLPVGTQAILEMIVSAANDMGANGVQVVINELALLAASRNSGACVYGVSAPIARKLAQ